MQTSVLNHFTTSPRGPGPIPVDGCPSRIRTSVHGSKVRCPTTRRRGSGRRPGEAPVASRANKWSGRRDSNPRPSPWQGDALPTEPLPLESPTTGYGGAESQNRTGDTAIFSRVLYQLSYLGPMANQALAARRRREDYHAPRSASKPGSGPERPEPDRWDERSGQIPMGGHLGRKGLPQSSSERPLLAT